MSNLVTDKELINLRRALLGLEGALHQIGEHHETFGSPEEMYAYARAAVEWARLTSTDAGLFAYPGGMSELSRLTKAAP